MTEKVFECIEECPKCNGTGIYCGMAERGGTGVVCHTCKGTGAHKFVHKYKDFVMRKEHTIVSRVFERNVGICLGPSIFGSLPYNDWCNGVAFPKRHEQRYYVCPRWYYQGTDKAPKFECHLSHALLTNCVNFDRKDICWAKWDAEQEMN